ncbi:protein TolR, partial [Thalassospira xiamenensis]
MGAQLASGSGGGRRRGRRSNRRRAMSDINVTPMVDVMLVLLVIFMVAAPLMTVGVEVDLPETSAAPMTGQDEPLVVSVTGDGT